MSDVSYESSSPAVSLIVDKFSITSNDCTQDDITYSMAVTSTTAGADLTLISFDASTRTITWYSALVITATVYTVTITGEIQTNQSVKYSGSLSFELSMTMPSCASTTEFVNV